MLPPGLQCPTRRKTKTGYMGLSRQGWLPKIVAAPFQDAV